MNFPIFLKIRALTNHVSKAPPADLREAGHGLKAS
jgi:hypothetical protein